MTQTYQYTTDELNEFYYELPLKMREYIVSMEVANIIAGIVQRSNLQKDQHIILGKEINLALLGLTTPEETTQNLIEKLRIPEEKVENIMNEVDTLIMEKALSIYEQEDVGSVRTQNPTPDKTQVSPARTPPEHPLPMVINKPTSFVANRLSGMTRMPKEEVVVSDKNQATTAPTKQKYGGPDPYREQI